MISKAIQPRASKLELVLVGLGVFAPAALGVVLPLKDPHCTGIGQSYGLLIMFQFGASTVITLALMVGYVLFDGAQSIGRVVGATVTASFGLLLFGLDMLLIRFGLNNPAPGCMPYQPWVAVAAAVSYVVALRMASRRARLTPAARR